MNNRTLKKIKAQAMREGGKILARIRRELVEAARPGTSLMEINDLAEKSIREAGGTPSFMLVPNYQYATCININDGVVHGIPTARKIQDGDLVKIDVGMYYHGFHTDAAITFISGTVQPDDVQFLSVGQQALKTAIHHTKSGNRIGHISKAIQRTIEGEGYTCIRSLTGHGIGQSLHEQPPIPCFLNEAIEKTPLLKEGQTLAIEVIYAKGSHQLRLEKDGWTLVTEDAGKAGLFEETVMVGNKHSLILTS